MKVILVAILVSGGLVFSISCTPKVSKVISGKASDQPFSEASKVACNLPVLVKAEGQQPKITTEKFEIQLGFESESQKKSWTKSGFPLARLVHKGATVPLPVKGLSGDMLTPITGKVTGNICQGALAVLDALQRVWLVFGQGDPNKLVMMAYDPRQKKLVDGHAPQKSIYGLTYNKGRLFYMTAEKTETPNQVFVNKSGKQLPLRELSLPYWVRLDLSGRERASVDPQKTYQLSAFRQLFDSEDKFHQFFGRNEQGLYAKPWAYVANVDEQTCLIASEKRSTGEISGSSMHCRKLAKAPASTAKDPNLGQ